MSSRAYTLTLLCASITLLALVVLGNAVVDPYGIHGIVWREGFNARKPAAAEVVRTAKPFQVRHRNDWRSLAVGNSRPEMGINPESPCLPAEHRPLYNMGLPGAGLAQQFDYARHALHGAPIQTVLIFLDYVDALGDEPIATNANARPWRRNLDFPSNPGRTVPLDTLVDSALSLDAAIDSLGTVLGQRDPLGPSRTAAGFNPAQDYLPIIRNEGINVLFSQKLDQLEERLQRNAPYAGDGHSSLELLKRFINDSRAAGADVHLVINPYHGTYLKTLETTGHGYGLLRWKADVSDTARRLDVALFDFAVRDQRTTEDMPAARAEEMTWFWEPAHYRQAFGDVILADVFSHACVNGTGRAP